MQNNVTGRIATGIGMALLMASVPLTVLAQVAPLDEASRTTVVMVAQRTAARVDPLIAPPLAVVPPDAPDTAPRPELVDPEPEPTDEPVALPELNLTDVVEYSSQGMSFQAPVDWVVATDLTEEIPFLVEVPGTEIFISMEADTGLDFPSWLGVALFRSQTDLLMQEMGEGAQLLESATLYTDQNLPMAKLEFIGIDGDEELAGALYVVAPNENAYLIIGGGTIDEWAYAAPGVELIARSVVFDEDLITVEQAGTEPMAFADEESGVSVTVPADWYVMPTGNEQFPVIAAEPEVRYVAAIGTEAAFGGSLDPEVLEVFTAEGNFDPDEADELIAELADKLENAGTPIFVDVEASEIIPREGATTVKLVGDADIDSGLSLPMLFYIDVRATGTGVVAVFGDTASALAVEADIQAMLESVATLE